MSEGGEGGEEEARPPLREQLRPDVDEETEARIREALRLLKIATLALAGLALFGVICYGLLLFRGVFGGGLLLLTAAVGLVMLPLLAMVGAGELVGNLLFKLATLPGSGAHVLNQRVDDTYEWLAVDPDSVQGSDSWWERFAGSRFGVTYDRVADAFGDLATEDIREAERVDPDDMVQTDGGKVSADSERGGIGQYLDLDDAGDPDTIWVEAAEKLSELEAAGGLDVGVRAKASALVEYGGDTSEVSPWAMLAGSVLMLVLGFGMSMLILG